MSICYHTIQELNTVYICEVRKVYLVNITCMGDFTNLPRFCVHTTEFLPQEKKVLLWFVI